MSDTSMVQARRPRKQAGTRSYGGVGQEERVALRREKLMSAAIEVFGTRGFHAATVREICGAAKLTERYFYESFRGLPELFLAVYQQLTDELMVATLAALQQAEQRPLKLAEAGLRTFLEFIREDARRARIALIDAISIGQSGLAAVERVAGDYAGLMESFVAGLYPNAADTGINVRMLSVGLVGLNTHIATSWARSGFVMPLEEVLQTNLLPYRSLDQAIGEALQAAAARSSVPQRT